MDTDRREHKSAIPARAGAGARPKSRRRLTLDAYVRRRLAGPGGDLAMMGRMFSRSFGAGSFAEFWRYWNPVYGFHLDRYCYRPLRRRRVPRSLAFVATFAASGFVLHDLPFWWGVSVLRTGSLPVPFVTVWFVTMSAFALVGERFRLDYAARPAPARVAINCAQIAAAWFVALGLAHLAR
jgi:D-alanyl-lipoteichoic acid acyltransferase DltB (MBOAT superfamily)